MDVAGERRCAGERLDLYNGALTYDRLSDNAGRPRRVVTNLHPGPRLGWRADSDLAATPIGPFQICEVTI